MVQFSTSLKEWVKHRVKLSTDTHPDWTRHTRREYAQEAFIVKKLLHSLIGNRNESTSRIHGEFNERDSRKEFPIYARAMTSQVIQGSVDVHSQFKVLCHFLSIVALDLGALRTRCRQ